LAFDDLREWIQALDRAGELKRIQAKVDPILEITEITDRVSKGRDGKGNPGGSALLFENIKGHPGSQVLINQFGSARRMNLALAVDSLDQVADRIRQFMDVKSPQGFLDKVKMLPMLAEMGKFFPKTGHGPVQGSYSPRRLFPARFSDSAVLAARCGALYHPAVCHHARP
jgi:4-hydroxy-3-polyprenylbenzoate decarboxylase